MYNTQPLATVVGNAFGLAQFFGEQMSGVEVEYLEDVVSLSSNYAVVIPDLVGLKPKLNHYLSSLEQSLSTQKVLMVLVTPSYSDETLIQTSRVFLDWCKTQVTKGSKDLRVVLVGDVITSTPAPKHSVLGRVGALIQAQKEPVVASDTMWFPVMVDEVVKASKKALFSQGTIGNVYQLNGKATPLIASILQLRSELAWGEYQPTLLSFPEVVTTLDPQQISLSWRLLKQSPTPPTASQLAAGIELSTPIPTPPQTLEISQPLPTPDPEPELTRFVASPPQIVVPVTHNPAPPPPTPTPEVVVESIRDFISSVELDPAPLPEVEVEPVVTPISETIDIPIKTTIQHTINDTKTPVLQKAFVLTPKRASWKVVATAVGLGVLGAALTLVLCVAIQLLVLRSQLATVVESIKAADVVGLSDVSRGLADSTERIMLASKLVWGVVTLTTNESQVAKIEAGLTALQQVSDMVTIASVTATEAQKVFEGVSGQNEAEIGSYILLVQSGLSRLSQETQQFLATVESYPYLQRFLDGYDQASLLEVVSILDQAAVMAKHAPTLLGIQERQTYAVLLQNSAELRPTGGFIGSFALVTFENGRLLDLRVEDVYAADGQLQGFVEPPAPIKAHLGEASWFLRDVNWDPHFPVTAERAAWFIEKELGIKVNGVIGVTLELAEALLEVTGPLYLPDYQLTVTAENLFQQAQFQSEINFFPGSTQKRDFLGSVTNELYRSLTTSAPLPQLASVISTSLTERTIQAWFFNPTIATNWQQTHWAGQLPTTTCVASSGECVKDVVAVIDANLGVNKANYFVKREIEYVANLTSPTQVSSQLVVRYTNNSPANTWPGGRYKNYLRVFVPSGSILSKVTNNGANIELSQIDKDTLRDTSVFGVLVEVPSSGVSVITFEYQRTIPSSTPLTYNLTHFKQAGSPDQPLLSRVVLPESSQLLHTHPAMVVAGNQISRAEPFSRDQSLVVEFTR